MLPHNGSRTRFAFNAENTRIKIEIPTTNGICKQRPRLHRRDRARIRRRERAALQRQAHDWGGEHMKHPAPIPLIAAEPRTSGRENSLVFPNPAPRPSREARQHRHA